MAIFLHIEIPATVYAPNVCKRKLGASSGVEKWRQNVNP